MAQGVTSVLVSSGGTAALGRTTAALNSLAHRWRPRATRFTGPTGLLSRRSGTSSIFYAFDPQGNPAEELNSSDAVTASLDFDAYGSRSVSGTAADPYSNFGSEYGYYSASETGLELLGYRYYDPSQGRFVNRDPIGMAGGVNVYGYTQNGPVDGADADGLFLIVVIVDPKTRLGTGILFPFPGDVVPAPPSGVVTIPLPVFGPIYVFPINNRVQNPGNPPWQVHVPGVGGLGFGPFQPGLSPIGPAIPTRYGKNGHRRQEGPVFIHIGAPGSIPDVRHTGWHGPREGGRGAGNPAWPTDGCLRSSQGIANWGAGLTRANHGHPNWIDIVN